ncbi:MAG: nitroreductase family protein [Syntrophales bacterium]
MTISETIQLRRSCRPYRDSPVEAEKLADLNAFLKANQETPFGSAVRFALLDLDEMGEDERRPLGTYGVIKGARLYIVGAVAEGPRAMEDFGYAMERNILRATALGLGTCWLGGTFRRSGFAARMHLAGGELLPAISPVGYPGEARSLTDRFFRFSAGSDRRKEWHELFSEGDPETPLSRESAGAYATALECVRSGPSASNKQPWRIVREGSAFHFFLARTPGYDRMPKGIPLQNVDMGIALCHFELAAAELGLAGRWSVCAPGIPPGGREYIASWTTDG